MKHAHQAGSKKLDFLVIWVLILGAYIYCRLTVNLYIGRGVFGGAVFTLPAVAYLGLRSPKPWHKIMISTVIFGALLGIFFEFFQEFNKAYAVINSVFPRILGVVPVDNVLGHVLMSLLTFTF